MLRSCHYLLVFFLVWCSHDTANDSERGGGGQSSLSARSDNKITPLLCKSLIHPVCGGCRRIRLFWFVGKLFHSPAHKFLKRRKEFWKAALSSQFIECRLEFISKDILFDKNAQHPCVDLKPFCLSHFAP